MSSWPCFVLSPVFPLTTGRLACGRIWIARLVSWLQASPPGGDSRRGSKGGGGLVFSNFISEHTQVTPGLPVLGHSPEMSSTPKNPKIGIRTPFWAIYLHQMVQYVVCTCSSYLALSEYVTYKLIALIFLSVLRI